MSARLGMMMTGGALRERARDRGDGDFYPTPPEATRAHVEWLNARALLDFNAPVFEPACGDGAMARVIESYGFQVAASDLHDRGFGEVGVDFLIRQFPPRAQIVTNPPYRDDLPDRFIRRVAPGARLLCLLLKATYWNAGPGTNGKPSRDALWGDCQPNAVLALTWRLDFKGLGCPTMDCAWNVWTDAPDFHGRTIYDRLSRPSSNLELFTEAGQSPASASARPQAPRAERASSAEGLNEKENA